MKKVTFGVVVGNRGCFPGSLVKDGAKNINSVLKGAGFATVAASSKDTKFGAVETFAEAKACAEIFRKNADKIDGIIVTLPNFGDEKGVLETIKLANLNVPILIHAEPDEPAQMTRANRRDSFCGKISVCNNLGQAGIPFTLTQSHTIKADSDEFRAELDDFASVCRIVNGLKNARFGAIGTRPAAFNTVRYSEKILELNGITVETIDLSEIIGRADRLKANDRIVVNKANAIKKYLNSGAISADVISKMSRFAVAVDGWVKDNDLQGTAIQCWTAIEEFFGIAPCALMSMMSESLLPSACEVDITGLLSMYVLQQASLTPSAILDWNNNYGGDADKCVLFHCSNTPASFLKESKMDIQAIMADTVGPENACGTVVGRIKSSPATFFRATTDDANGCIAGYAGEGEFTNDKLETFGGYGVMKIQNLQSLLQYICQAGFEHHVAVNLSRKADAITEALANYMCWDVYRHA